MEKDAWMLNHPEVRLRLRTVWEDLPTCEYECGEKIHFYF